MSGVSSAELLLLVVIGLIVLGPKRLPEIANRIGGWIGQARRMTRVMKRQLEDELNVDSIHTLQPREATKQTAASTAPDPADPAYDVDEPVENHIPRDDDSYSPRHDPEAEQGEDLKA